MLYFIYVCLQDNKPIRNYFIILLAIILNGAYLFADDQNRQYLLQGIPLIENFQEEDYGSESVNYDITCSGNNLVYVLNPRGILEFDGLHWRMIQSYLATPKDQIHYSRNKLFYIKSQSIGFLYPDSNGTFKDSVLVRGKNLNGAFALNKINDNKQKVFFVSKECIYVWSEGDSLQKITVGNNLCASTIFNGKLLVNDYPNGLFLLENNQLKPYFTDAVLQKSRIYNISAPDSTRLLLNIIHNGIYELDNNELKLINNSVEYFGNLAPINDNYLLYSTLMNGMVKFNTSGRITGLINYSVGLTDNNISNICQSPDQNTWVCTKNGISHLATGFPLSVYNKSSGLQSHIENIVMHKGSVWVCTKNGLFRIKDISKENTRITQDRYELVDEVKGINALCYKVYSINNYLLLSTITGIYIIDGLEAIPLRDYHFKQKPTITSFHFIKTISGYAYYKYENNKIRRTGHQQWMFKDLVFGKDKIWYLDSNLVVRLSVYKEKFEAKPFDLPRNLSHTKSYYLFSDSSTVYLASRGHVDKYLNDQNIWIKDTALSSILDNNEMIVNCYYTNGEKEMILSISNVSDYSDYKTAMYTKKDGWYFLSVNLSAYLGNPRINTVFIQSDSLWWIGTKDELYAFNPKLTGNPDSTRRAAVRRIDYKSQHQTLWLGYGIDNEITFPFSRDELSFTFFSNTFNNRNLVQYSYWLEGYQKKWSDFQTSNQVNYTNLSEGDYTLHLRAKFTDGYISDATYLNFSITPPWYRSVLAYISYLFVFLLSGYLLIKWRLRYIEQDRRKLEKEVHLRTLQLNQTNEELLHKTHELEEMDKVKSNFFANISHELRTPLTLILGPLNNLIGKEKDKEKLNEFRVMLRNSMALKQHIEQFLELSKIESGNLNLDLETIELNSFIKRIISAFESLADVKSITLGFSEFQSKIYSSVDQKNMEIVLNNLLSNAIKFTPSGGKVSIGLTGTDTGVQINVSDTGIGIDQQHLPFIFKRFYQADTTTSKKYEGTGIGLALSKEIVELHKGTISVESSPGKGSVFSVCLPVIKDPDYTQDKSEDPVSTGLKETEVSPINISQNYYDSIEPEEPEYTNGKDLSEAAKETVDSNKPEKIQELPVVLVVEDNPDMQNYLKGLLEKQFTVHLADNGEEGLLKTRVLNPHLIVSDVMMPVKDGFSMVDDIRKDKDVCHIPIIMLTALADEKSKLSGLRKGIEEYLSKPFSEDELLIRINNIIRRRSEVKEKVTKKLVLEPQELELTSLDEQFLLKAGEIIEQNLTNSEFDIQQMSDILGISRRHLHRKLKLLTDMSPSEFVRSYRLKKAARLIQSKADSISQVAYAVGFDDLSYFTKCFKAQFGKTPSEF